MTKRDRIMLLTVLAVALLGGFWMFVLSPQRKAASDVVAQVAAAQASLDEARGKVTSGLRAQKSFRKDRLTIVRLGRVVPETDDVPTLLTQLQALATKEKVDFLTYQVESNAGATTSDATNSDKTASNTTGAQTGTGSTDTVAPLFPPGTVEIDGGLGRTPISLEFEGTYFQLERYLRSVQRFAVLSQKSTRAKGRLMIVDAFSYESATADASGPATNGKLPERFQKQPKLRAKLSASVYFAPPLEAPTAAGSGQPAPAATPSASAGSSTGTAAIGGVR